MDRATAGDLQTQNMEITPARGLEMGPERRLFGLPLDPTWWLALDGRGREAARCLFRRNPSFPRDDDPNLFMGFVVGALDRVAAWKKRGLQVERPWVDLGGGAGYFALALRLLGAPSATVVDLVAPGPLVRSVLETAGVEFVEGDIARVRVPRATAGLGLYCSRCVDAFLANNPALETLIAAPPAWGSLLPPVEKLAAFRRREIIVSSEFTMSEDECVPFRPSQETFQVSKFLCPIPPP